MSLYRDSLGFLCAFASDPGAGYTPISAMPTDTIENRANWWRALDIYGQTSAWHPSITGGYEVPSPAGLSGRGVNVLSARYTYFDSATGFPSFYVSSATVASGSPGYIGSLHALVTATANNGDAWFTPTSVTYNTKLTQNMRWIMQFRCAPQDANSQNRSFSLLFKTATGTTIVVPFTSGATAGTYTLYSCVLDLTADTNVAGRMGFRIANSGVALRFDALMLEEQVGSGSSPSAFSAPPNVIDGSQIVMASLIGDHFENATITGDKFEALTVTSREIGTLSVNTDKVSDISISKISSGTVTSGDFILSGTSASIKSNNFVPGSSGFRILGDGSAEFRNATIRGSLNASDLVAGSINASGSVSITNLNAANLTVGTINGSRFGTDTISGGPIIPGTLHKSLQSINQGASWNYVNNAAELTSGSAWLTPITVPANANRTAILMFGTFNLSMNSLGGGYTMVAGFRRGTTTVIAKNFQNVHASFNDTLPVIGIDTGMGTGSVTYYPGMHHSATPVGGNLPGSFSWILFEFSK